MDIPSDRTLRSRRRDGDVSRSRNTTSTSSVGQPLHIDEPLIHPNILDPASQRLWLASLFVVIQCSKIYDVILLKTGVERTIAAGLLPLNSFTFVVKYAIAEGLFLWILPVLNIQYLTFSPFKTLLITFLLNGYTFVLASDTTLPILSGIVLPIWQTVYKRKELTIGGDTVTPLSAIDMSSHFKGKLTINYLPDLSAKLNPFQFENLCTLPDSRTKPGTAEVGSIIHMPIEFNTTNQLGSMVIEHVNPYNQVSYLNFSYHDLSKLAKRDYSHLLNYISKTAKLDNRVFHLEIPLKEPGSYKIHSVKDSKGINIRTYKSTLLLLNCPSAQFVYPKAAVNYNTPVCVKKNPLSIPLDRLELPLVSAFGVAPLALKFSAKIAGQSKEFTITVDKTTTETETTGHIANSERNMKDLSWLGSSTVSRNLLEQELLLNPSILSLSTSKNDIGRLEFYLSEVIDSMGHLTRYNPSSRSEDIFYSIDLRNGPSILLSQQDPDQLLLINNTKSVYLKSNDLRASDFPLTVDMSFKDKHNEPLSWYNFTKIFVDSNELRHGFQVDKPGIYSIVSGTSKFCPCDIRKDQMSIEVGLAPLPNVEILAEPIVDKCVGMTGYQFEFEFTGKPPFQVQYQVFRKQPNGIVKPLHNEHGNSVRYLKSYNSKFEYIYKPPREGTYLVVFNKLQDMNYQMQPVLLDESKHTYETYFKQRSSASFSKPGGSGSLSRSSCLNQDSTIPLYLNGNPPFSFKYSIIEKDSRKKVVDNEIVSDINSDVYEIKTPVFNFGGEFLILVTELKDSLLCDVDFNYDTEIYTVKTRKDTPAVSFPSNFKNKDVKIIEGDSLRIPLELKSSTGRSNNDLLVYSITNLNDSSKVETFNLRDLNTFSIKKEGIYTLESFKNGQCAGEVPTTKETITVRYYDRPTLEVLGNKDSSNVLSQIDNTIHLKPVCENGANEINLKLTGVPPFVINYDISLPTGKHESRTMTVEGHHLKINLSSGENGRFKHTFRAVYDKLYTKEKAKKQNINKSVTYDIHPLPEVLFAKRFSQICESNVNKVGVITEVPIKFSGTYPFNVSLSLQNENTGKVEKFSINDVTQPTLKIDKFHDLMTVGNHILTINEVTDGNGCKRKEHTDLNSFVISITEVPNISKIHGQGLYKNTPSHYCVGDHIRYNMSGIPPFTVYYDFNGVPQRAELSPPLFQRLASKAGNLSITALLDSASNKCLVNFTTQEVSKKYEELKIKIYDLPSVEINQGDYIIQDIHEGDQTDIIFAFEGVPPFTLTYVRTVQVKSGNKFYNKVVETETIRDIWDYEYTVRASLEGTYEAIELSDAYCVAKRDEQY